MRVDYTIGLAGCQGFHRDTEGARLRPKKGASAATPPVPGNTG